MLTIYRVKQYCVDLIASHISMLVLTITLTNRECIIDWRYNFTYKRNTSNLLQLNILQLM